MTPRLRTRVPFSPSPAAAQELRAEADAEAAALVARLSEGVARDEIVAGRIKAEFWDGLQVGAGVRASARRRPGAMGKRGRRVRKQARRRTARARARR